MDHKLTKELVYQSLNLSDSELPTFESVLERVLIIDIHTNRTRPYAIHSCPHPTSATPTPSSNVPSSTALATTASSNTAPSNPHAIATTTSCPPHSANYCTGCKCTGHMIFDCWHTGGEQEGHTKAAQTHIVNVEVDDNPDGGGTTELEEDMTSVPITALVTQQHSCLPTPTAAINNDIYLDLYDIGVTSSYAFSSLSELLPFESPVFCASITNSFNTILDSGCTNHIIHDWALFWTYKEDQAVPVKTANCGILKTLACGDVKF